METRLAVLQSEIEESVVGPIGLNGFSSFFPDVGPETSATPSEEQAKAFRDLPGQFFDIKDEVLMYEPLAYTTFDDQEIKPDLMGFKGNHTQTMLEVKLYNSSDPFDDDHTFVKSTQEARYTLGQITSYATCHQACHFRTHVFSFLILPTYLRILRWDRSGVLVSEKLLFEKATTVVLLLRFVAATLTQLGHDNSLTSKTDLPSAKKDEIRDELKLDADARLAKIYIKKREFIIARIQPPGSTSPIGRSTRCYKAYCLETNRVVLLKDTWRVVSESLRPEHEIYTTLHENEVPHILEVITAGDVGKDRDPHHTTQTKAWVSKTRQKLNILDLQHYRIALEYVPFRVDQFEGVRQPIMAIRDAARAHGIAATVAKVLHRDISVGNIMFKIDENGNVFGYLIDWDLSLDLSQATLEAQLERTGTWQFTAARLLERPRNNEPLIHNRIDDVESFFHLTNWLALRYTPHSLDGSELAQALRENFEDSY
ncbi:hypothetical protein H0H93_010456, partial [Arthromyces matolae]